jgi:hypothetical protein
LSAISALSVMGLVIEVLVDCPTLTFLGHSSHCYGNWLVIDRQGEAGGLCPPCFLGIEAARPLD